MFYILYEQHVMSHCLSSCSSHVTLHNDTGALYLLNSGFLLFIFTSLWNYWNNYVYIFRNRCLLLASPWQYTKDGSLSWLQRTNFTMYSFFFIPAFHKVHFQTFMFHINEKNAIRQQIAFSHMADSSTKILKYEWSLWTKSQDTTSQTFKFWLHLAVLSHSSCTQSHHFLPACWSQDQSRWIART